MAYCSDLTDATAYAAARIGIGLDGRSSLPESAARTIWGGQAARIAGALGSAGIAISSSSLAKSWAADVERRATSGHCLLAVGTGVADADVAYGRSLVSGANADMEAARGGSLYGWLMANGAEAADQSASGLVWSSYAEDRDPSVSTIPGIGRPYQPPASVHEGDPR